MYGSQPTVQSIMLNTFFSCFFGDY